MNKINLNSDLIKAKLIIQPVPGLLMPYEFTGVRDEITSYMKTAWIGTALNTNTPVYDIIGPDAKEFFHRICVNDFTKLGDTGMRHAVICNDEGLLMADGVVIKIGENHYRTYWINAPIDYYVQKSDLDIKGINMMGKEYFIQIDGEKSLEILEDAFQEDLHDIHFAKHRIAMLGDKKVRVLRLSMTGNLGYELHGPMEEFNEVYTKIVESGEKFGAKLLGLHAYNVFNHTEAGFPNIQLHYPLPWIETNDEMSKYMYKNPQFSSANLNRGLEGSLGENIADRFVTPYDIGLDNLIKFNHDFIGREALERISYNPPRIPVTLEWNPEDVAKVFATQITPGEEVCDPIYKESDEYVRSSPTGQFYYHHDWVQKDGKNVGVSTGRIISYNFNSMISLAWIDKELATKGNELTVLWGTPGTRQELIRVKIVNFPYNGESIISNQEKNVSEIPTFNTKQS